LGSSQPDFYGGLRNNITYKNWNLDVFIHGSYGNDILDGSILRGYFGRGGNENVRPEVKDMDSTKPNFKHSKSWDNSREFSAN
jgi:hypothetical protein